MLSFHFDYSLLHCIKTFKFIRSHVFIFVFISITLGCRSQRFMSKRVLTMFSSKIYKASGLIFRYLTHFEFIFAYGVRKCSSFIFLHVAIQFSQHHLLKRLLFLYRIFFPPVVDDKVP